MTFAISPEYRASARAQRLDTLERCLLFDQGVVVKAARQHREVRRIDSPEGAVFLKRVFGRGFREVPHECRILTLLLEKGLPVPKPLVLGVRSGAAALVTEALPEARTLEDLLLNGDLIGPSRRRLFRNLADLVRRMHEAGVNHRDLYAGHVHVTDNLELFLVDLGRAESRRRVPRYRVTKDLAALNTSIPDRIVGRGERLRFLRLYMGAEAKKSAVLSIARAIERKSLRMRRHAERMLSRGEGNVHINR
jgi:heptose I phosphotransferase